MIWIFKITTCNTRDEHRVGSTQGQPNNVSAGFFIQLYTKVDIFVLFMKLTHQRRKVGERNRGRKRERKREKMKRRTEQREGRREAAALSPCSG